MVLKAVKMRIYPNSEQRDRLMQTFGCARFVWNQMLNMQIERRKNNPDAKFVNAFGMNNLLKRLKEEYPWLKQAESTSLQSANRNLADAFQRFFKGPETWKRRIAGLTRHSALFHSKNRKTQALLRYTLTDQNQSKGVLALWTV